MFPSCSSNPGKQSWPCEIKKQNSPPQDPYLIGLWSFCQNTGKCQSPSFLQVKKSLFWGLLVMQSWWSLHLSSLRLHSKLQHPLRLQPLIMVCFVHSLAHDERPSDGKFYSKWMKADESGEKLMKVDEKRMKGDKNILGAAYISDAVLGALHHTQRYNPIESHLYNHGATSIQRCFLGIVLYL